MSKVLGDIELISGVVINLAAQSYASDPEFDSGDEGMIIYNSTEKAYKYNNGSSWVAFEISLTSSTELIETLGSNWINEDFSFNPTDFNLLDNITGLTVNDNLFTVLSLFDDAITDAKTVTTLRGVTLNFDPEDLTAGNIVFFDGVNFVPGSVNDLDTVELEMSELQGTAISDPQQNDIIVYASGNWVNKPAFYLYEELSGTLNVFTVNHSLGQRFCHVTVIDMSLPTPSSIDPAEIVSVGYNSDTTLTVTLSGNKPVTIIVSGLSN